MMGIEMPIPNALLILGLLVSMGLCLIASAIVIHTLTVRTVARDEVRRISAATPIDETNWCWLVEQIAADVLGESVCVMAFSGMLDGQRATMRFVLRDGRTLMFSRTRRLRGCRGLGRRVVRAQTQGLMHALWDYFARSTDLALPVPSNAQWFVQPLQPQQQRHLLIAPIRRSGKVSKVSVVSEVSRHFPIPRTLERSNSQ